MQLPAVQVLRPRMGAEAKRFDLPESNGGPLDMQASTGLLSLEWSRELVQSPGTVPVLTAGALVSSDSELPPDHLVTHANTIVLESAGASSPRTLVQGFLVIARQEA